MPVRRQPVVGEPAGHPRKEEGGEVRERAGLGQDQEPGVVRHHLQPPELLLRSPAAPPVARSALEGAVLPRRQAQPPVPEACHVAQAAGRQPLEAEMAALVHQRVPERALLRPGQPDLDVRQGKPRRHPAKRGMELEALANRHGRSIARPGRERQRKIPAPRSRAHATQTSPVSRKTSRNQRGMPLEPSGDRVSIPKGRPFCEPSLCHCRGCQGQSQDGLGGIRVHAGSNRLLRKPSVGKTHRRQANRNVSSARQRRCVKTIVNWHDTAGLARLMG